MENNCVHFLAKIRAPEAMAAFREMCLLDVLFKFYMMCLVSVIQRQPTPSHWSYCCNFAYCPTVCCNDLNILLKWVLAKIWDWRGGEEVYVGGGDIFSAFDNASIELLVKSLKSRRTHPQLIAADINEMRNLTIKHDDPFSARFFNAKGWVDWTSGLTIEASKKGRDFVTECLGEVEKCLTVHRKLDFVNMKLSMDKIEGRVSYTAFVVWFSAECPETEGRHGRILRENMPQLKFSLEVAPDRKHINQAAGRMFTYVRSNDVPSNCIFPEWKFNGVDFYKVDSANLNAKGVLLAQYVCERIGFAIYEGDWQDLIPGVSADTVQAVVRSN